MQISATTIVMKGYQHDLPSIVYECVEELYRTGIYHRKLFLETPVKHNVDRMRRIFDRGYKRPPGVRIGPLAKYATKDVCGLLEHFLERLPDPIVPRDINYGLWCWCVNPVLQREWDIRFPPVIKRRRRTIRGEVPEMEHKIIEDPNLTPEERRAVREEFDAPLVEIARYTLRLLSVEHLSLLVYLFDFFKCVMDHPENGMNAEYLGEKFGYILLGGTSYAAGRTLMMWLLERWERVSKGLLDIAPPGTRRFVSHEPDIKSMRAAEVRRRKYAISPHQPYERVQACGDESSDNSSRTFVNSYEEGRDNDEGSVLDYYYSEHKHKRDVHETPAVGQRTRKGPQSRREDEAHRPRRFADIDDDELELEIRKPESQSLRRFLRKEQRPRNKRRDTLEQDCDDYGNYF
ncbi:Rho GTPase activation protein [Rhodofomes roseus]|uniref:Rho GTPase activation protein n=1 Tax=Rhodofomes roseus TaxID=34475 RepID=A0ABQ8KBU6_9APHY|nr:Rho GTPase activation protein [Rhodofomes roseus]KAH9835027.1 Rho GTPase activation protein [Rhodofomes roseus]